MKLFITSLCLAALALPISVSIQAAERGDYRQSVKEIKEAFKAGKLSKEEAAAKIAALKQAAADKGKGGKGKILSDYQAIEAAVKAGNLTKEEAAAKLAALKQAADAKGKGGAKHNQYQAIEAAVKAGKLTKEEAAAKIAALKQAAADKGKGGKGKILSDYQAIEAAVKAGKLTKEEAAAKLAALKQAAAKDKQGAAARLDKNDLLAKRLSQLVQEGIVSQAQAKAMWAAAQKTAGAKKAD